IRSRRSWVERSWLWTGAGAISRAAPSPRTNRLQRDAATARVGRALGKSECRNMAAPLTTNGITDQVRRRKVHRWRRVVRRLTRLLGIVLGKTRASLPALHQRNAVSTHRVIGS